ncbi:MAG: GNAT family N-acetyltransferase [Euryarchaeota archaeon]|nr:GNAT family N-acetyltransferase [Euryarchaeota archaeon]MBV1754134.1 GNAT family N-acetyltransferase [Methanobacterium sp.]MBV1767509.1 GNAT family N-acetyltransferase [Methanobacterium sp.]
MGIGCALSFGKTAWLGHIIVEEKYRNKGVGSNLVEYLCTYLENRGALTISLITTPGAFKFYQKLGFKVDTEYIFLEGDGPLEAAHSPKVDKSGKKDQDQILKLDKMVSGENRGHLLDDYLKQFLCLPGRG